MTSNRYGAINRDYQSYSGPGDRDLPQSEVAGYQPASRIGEIVVNCFVDPHEWTRLPSSISGKDLNPAIHAPHAEGASEAERAAAGAIRDSPYETKPHFYEWATVQPGMICLSRKKKTSVYRQSHAAETASPVVASVACLTKDQENEFFFAGVARTKSVRSPNDGQGETVDEYFTLAIGGMMTILNTSGRPLCNGDLVEWTFIGAPFENRGMGQEHANKRLRPDYGPRRVAVRQAGVSSQRVIGRVMHFAKPGENVDILLKQ